MKLWLLTIGVIGTAASTVPPGDGVEIRTGTRVEFAPAAVCARVLSSHDIFVGAMSPFDRSARLKTDKDVTEAQYLAFAGQQARDWNEREKERLRAILESFRAKTTDLDLRFPPTIFLLKTTGLDEGMAAYCRGSSIVLPEKLLEGKPGQLETLVFHELFHIYRRQHYEENRRELYKIVGFEVCPEIALPEQLRRRKITNPDAPLLDTFIRLEAGRRTVAAMPVLFATSERYDMKQGGEFFDNMLFRLLVLNEVNGRFQPSLLPSGEPDLLDPSGVPDYLNKIGRNTKYTIHPEEILADNFVLMINARSPVPSPRILLELRSLLTK